MIWFTYVIFNRDAQKIYVGQTNNFERRIQEHNSKKGNHFTAKTEGKWELIYKEEFNTKREALKREKQLKSYRGRQSLKIYIPR